MAQVAYAIIRADDCWRILSGRRRIGRFATCTEAATAAVNLAKEAALSDHAAEVLIQDAAGQLWPVAQFDPASACAGAQPAPWDEADAATAFLRSAAS